MNRFGYKYFVAALKGKDGLTGMMDNPEFVLRGIGLIEIRNDKSDRQ
jgi:hypothetical protein